MDNRADTLKPLGVSALFSCLGASPVEQGSQHPKATRSFVQVLWKWVIIRVRKPLARSSVVEQGTFNPQVAVFNSSRANTITQSRHGGCLLLSHPENRCEGALKNDEKQPEVLPEGQSETKEMTRLQTEIIALEAHIASLPGRPLPIPIDETSEPPRRRSERRL